jgi:hypothetical protein
MTKAQALEAYAIQHYSAGGNWIAETYETADYQQVVDAAGGDIDEAKAAIKRAWLFQVEQESNCGDY